MSFLRLLLQDKFLWMALGVGLCVALNALHDWWYRWRTRDWGKLVAACAHAAYRRTEKECDESRYYKLGKYMHLFAQRWRASIGEEPGPEEQAAAAMIAALLAEDEGE